MMDWKTPEIVLGVNGEEVAGKDYLTDVPPGSNEYRASSKESHSLCAFAKAGVFAVMTPGDPRYEKGQGCGV